jgi:hypothetical protein
MLAQQAWTGRLLQRLPTLAEVGRISFERRSGY